MDCSGCRVAALSFVLVVRYQVFETGFGTVALLSGPRSVHGLVGLGLISFFSRYCRERSEIDWRLILLDRERSRGDLLVLDFVHGARSHVFEVGFETVRSRDAFLRSRTLLGSIDSCFL